MPPKTIQRLRDSRVFDTLDEQALEDLTGMVKVVNLPDGEVLFEKGEPGNHLYTINEGLLKISVTDPATDREKTLALIGEGEVVGEMAVFSDNQRSGRAIAIRETSLLQIPEDNFLNILSDYPEVGQNLIGVLCERLMMTDEEIQSVTFQSVPGRLAAQLLRLADKFGKDTDEGREITIALTHEQLGDLVGTNRETVTRYLNEFQDEGSVERNDQRIVIRDRQTLEQWF